MMEDTIEINGKVYSKDKIEKVMKVVREVWEKVKKIMSSLLEFLIRKLRKLYHQLAKCKSNNWRKAHGLKPIRRPRRYGKH